MRTFLFIVAGLIAGLLAAMVLVLVVGWVFPFFLDGGGRDAMSQGIMGTLVFVFSAPPLCLIACITAYRRAKKPEQSD